MDLVQVETDAAFSVYKYESPNGQWQLGARAMLFGVRLCATSKGSVSYALDYCTADNVTFRLLLCSILHQIFGLLPETITEREIERLFPPAIIKPIYKDCCWQLTQNLLLFLRAGNDYKDFFHYHLELSSELNRVEAQLFKQEQILGLVTAEHQ